jgi:hypothetical protein
MRHPRFQFRLSTLLWITAVVAGFFGGAAWQRQRTDDEALATQRKAEQSRVNALKALRKINEAARIARGRLRAYERQEAEENRTATRPVAQEPSTADGPYPPGDPFAQPFRP